MNTQIPPENKRTDTVVTLGTGLVKSIPGILMFIVGLWVLKWVAVAGFHLWTAIF